ncbi:sugar phosphate isomerase/epimerase family protein [Amphibacillus sp. Q70]|uniref:sugar phosphate isomerase/epimerase family protein n=1 Tax=Amphibacillus sp. Q70 TaxID=3453416 RepID=UPI003F871100
MKQSPVAVQLYTLREALADDFIKTLKRVAEIGYDGVELAGYGDLTVVELKEQLDQLGLKVAGNHVPLEDLQKKLDQVIADQKVLENKYVVCPFILPEDRHSDFYHDLAQFLNETGKQLKEHGLVLCYHNHDFELEKMPNGQTVLAYLFDRVAKEDLQAELDLYWLQKAGEAPIDWIKRYHDRTPLIHLKDMTTDEEQFFAELGTGGLDLETILTTGQPEWWIVEQDVSRIDPLESIQISYQYLQAKGVV